MYLTTDTSARRTRPTATSPTSPRRSERRSPRGKDGVMHGLADACRSRRRGTHPDRNCFQPRLFLRNNRLHNWPVDTSLRLWTADCRARPGEASPRLSTFPQPRTSTAVQRLTSMFTETIHRLMHRTLAWQARGWRDRSLLSCWPWALCGRGSHRALADRNADRAQDVPQASRNSSCAHALQPPRGAP